VSGQVLAPKAILVSMAVRREAQALDLERTAFGTELHSAARAMRLAATQEREDAEKRLDEHIDGQASAIEALQRQLEAEHARRGRR
jgi:hypothetical protein